MRFLNPWRLIVLVLTLVSACQGPIRDDFSIDSGPRDADTPLVTCTATDAGEQVCTCPDGYWVDGTVCRINACEQSENGGCDTYATCTPERGGRTCTCKPGFTGDGETCVPVSGDPLRISQSSLDFGAGCLEATSRLDLKLENAGDEVLNIRSLEVTSSSFSLVDPPELPLVIPGRGSVTLTVFFSPLQEKTYAGTLEIESAVGEAPPTSHQVNLFGRGMPGPARKFEVSCICERSSYSDCGLPRPPAQNQSTDRPCMFLSFEDVPAGTQIQRTIRLENSGCETLLIQPQLTGDVSDQQYFSVSGPASMVLAGGVSTDVVVTFSPPANSAIYPDVGLNLVSDDPNLQSGQTSAGTWGVSLIANSVNPQLVVAPSNLSFFDADLGQTVTKQFTLYNDGVSVVKIDKVELISESGATDYVLTLPNGQTSFTLSPAGAAGSERTISVSFTPTKAGIQRAAVRVTSGTLTQTVDVIGGIEPNLVIEWLDPGSSTYAAPPIDFGAVATGAKGLKRTVRLSNAGHAMLELRSIALRDPNGAPSTSFKIDPFAHTSVQPGQSVQIEVTFDDNLGIKDDLGKFVVASNDPLDATNPNGERTVDVISQNDPNLRPIVTVSSSGTQVCQELMLDASSSIGPEAGDTLSFAWSLIVKPAGSEIYFESPTSSKTRILSPNCPGPDKIGTYDFRVTVTDQFQNQSNSAIRVVVQ